jgi:hypothetical protein
MTERMELNLKKSNRKIQAEPEFCLQKSNSDRLFENNKRKFSLPIKIASMHKNEKIDKINKISGKSFLKTCINL